MDPSPTTTPQNKSKRSVRARSARTKSSLDSNNLPTVRISSAIKPYRSDPIINFTIRYQANTNMVRHAVTRGMNLSTLLMGNTSVTSPRLLSSVRVNKLTITTSISAAITWASQYAPASETVITGTSTTAPGIYTCRPPKNSTASFWSLQNQNEGEVLLYLTMTQQDYLDVHFSAVLMDDLAPAFATTTAISVSGQLYRTYFDGPAAGAELIPVLITAIN